MHRRLTIALIALAVAALTLGSGAEAPGKAVYVGSYRWTSTHGKFGGFSGLEISDDGIRFWTVSDGGILAQGRFQRDPQTGVIIGVSGFEPLTLKTTKGAATKDIWDDAEGLAVAKNGQIFVSFEGIHRIWRYDEAGGDAVEIPSHSDFADLQNNSALEALAMNAAGALFTLPERSGVLNRPFPVYRYRDGKWDQPFAVKRRPPYLPVGADFGPDGRFYLLERHLSGMLGFQSRVRRFVFSQDGVSEEEVVFSSAVGEHDNLEGIAVWRAGDGDIRITMISDDNYRAFQRTEFVEYRVAE